MKRCLSWVCGLGLSFPIRNIDGVYAVIMFGVSGICFYGKTDPQPYIDITVRISGVSSV